MGAGVHPTVSDNVAAIRRLIAHDQKAQPEAMTGARRTPRPVALQRANKPSLDAPPVTVLTQAWREGPSLSARYRTDALAAPAPEPEAAPGRGPVRVCDPGFGRTGPGIQSA